MDKGRPRDALIALDLLRFAAAALVMLFHFSCVWVNDQSPLVLRLTAGAEPPYRGGPILPNGWVGVQIFFVLSGYVIAASARRGNAADFAWRRWLRLAPAALVCSVITAATLALHGEPIAALWRPALAAATLWPIEPLIDPSYWTLGVECAFYALVALLLARGWWRPLRVAHYLIAISAGFWLWKLAGQFAGMDERARVEELLLLRHGALFALGILLHLYHQGTRGRIILSIAPALFAGLMSVLFGALIAAKTGAAASPLGAMTIFLGGVAVIALAPRLQPALERWRVARPAVALGLATYPLYLLHQRVGFALIGDLARAGMSTRLAIVVTISLMIAAALIVANRIEPAMRAALNRGRSPRPARDLRQDSPRSAFLRGG